MLSSTTFRALITIESSALCAHRAEIDSIFNELKETFPALFAELEPELTKVLSESTASSQLDDQPAKLNAPSSQNKETKPGDVTELRRLLTKALEAEELTKSEEKSTVRQSDKCFYDAIFNILIELAWQFPLNQRNDQGQPYDDLNSGDEDENLTPDNNNAVATPDGRLHKKNFLNEYFETNNAFFVKDNTVFPRTPEGKVLNGRLLYYLQKQGITILIPSLRELNERRGYGGQRLDELAPEPSLLQAISLLLLQSSFEQPPLQMFMILNSDSLLNAPRRDEPTFNSLRPNPPLNFPRREQPLADLEESSTGYKISYGIALFNHILWWTIKTVALGFLYFSLVGSGVVVPALIFYGVSSIGLALACAHNKPGSYKEKLILFFQTVFASYKESTTILLIGGSLGIFFMSMLLPGMALVASFSPALIYLIKRMTSNAGDEIQSCTKFVESSIVEERWSVLESASLILKCSKGIMFMLRSIRDAFSPHPLSNPPQNAVAVTVPPQHRSMSTLLLLNRLLTIEETRLSSLFRWFQSIVDSNNTYHPPLFSSFQRNQQRLEFMAAIAAVTHVEEGQQRQYRG